MKRGPYKQKYTQEALQAAVKACQASKSYGVCQASRDFGVPKNTISRHLTPVPGRPTQHVLAVPTPVRKTPDRCVLTEYEENKLVDLIVRAARHNCAMSKIQIFAYVMRLVTDIPREHPAIEAWAKNGAPGRDWWEAFLRRHDNLAVRAADMHDHKRRQVTKEDIDSLYGILQDIYSTYEAEYGVPLTPDRIFNLDETCIRPDADFKVVTVRASQDTKAQGNVNRDSVTFLPCVSADGQSLPPLIIPKGQSGTAPNWWHKMADLVAGTSMEDSTSITQENGYMTCELFELYMEEVFMPCTVMLRESAPVVLLLDNFNAHVELRIIEKAIDANIIMIGFPPHATHIVQPLDRSCMRPLKHWYNTAAQLWRMQPGNFHKVVTCKHIIEILSTQQPTQQGSAWDMSFSAQNVRAGFIATGIWPLDKTALGDLYNKCPSIAELEMQEEAGSVQRTASTGRSSIASATAVSGHASCGHHTPSPNHVQSAAENPARDSLDILADVALANTPHISSQEMDTLVQDSMEADRNSAVDAVLTGPWDNQPGLLETLRNRQNGNNPTNARLLTARQHLQQVREAAERKAAEAAAKEQRQAERKAAKERRAAEAAAKKAAAEERARAAAEKRQLDAAAKAARTALAQAARARVAAAANGGVANTSASSTLIAEVLQRRWTGELNESQRAWLERASLYNKPQNDAATAARAHRKSVRAMKRARRG